MVKNHFIKDKASEIARGELDLEKGIKKIVSNRMARFFMDSTSAGSAGGNLMDLGLDSDAILTVSLISMGSFINHVVNFLGIFDPQPSPLHGHFY